MTKQIEFVPQGNPTTEALKLSIACQLLYSNISTMEVMFQENPESYSTDDWENFIKACKFLNEVAGKKFRIYKDVEHYLDGVYQEMNRRCAHSIPTR